MNFNGLQKIYYLRKKVVLAIIRFSDLKDKFLRNLFFLLVTCYIRYNLLQDSTEKRKKIITVR